MKPLAIARGAPLSVDLPGSIVEALWRAVDAHPGGGFVFADRSAERTLSYAECRDRALRAAAGLAAAGVRAGDPLIVDTGDPEAAIPVLWAGLLGGLNVAPVQVSRWNTRGAGEARARIESIAQRLGSPVTVSADAALFAHTGGAVLAPAALQRHGPCARDTLDPAAYPRVLVATSGTTGRAQLVELDARALMHRWWPAGIEGGGAHRWIGWMPMDHVMGLGMAGPAAHTRVLLSAEAFIQTPQRWLELVERYRVTHAGMSSFALRRVADALEAGPDRDLSSVLRIGVGAEPVDRTACARFLSGLIRCGGPDDAVILGYGLSECGPVAGGERPFRPLPGRAGPVPIDRPTAGHAIRIVNDQGEICREGEEGAIEVRGPTMTNGYHGDPLATARLLTDDGWLRSGDLGWIEEGCLHVSGRAKEVLVVNARKYPCVEVDALAVEIAGVTEAYAFADAAPSGEGERPSLVYVTRVLEVDHAAIQAAIRKVCADRFGFGLRRCLPIAAEDLPRTANGKLQRHEIAAVLASGKPRDSQGTAGRVDAADASDPVIDRVRRIMHGVLSGLEPGPDDDFFDLGGDSLGVLMLALDLEREFSVFVPPAIVARNPTARALAAHVVSAPARVAGVVMVDALHPQARKRLFVAPGIWGYNGFAPHLERVLGSSVGLWSLHIVDTPAPEAHNLEELAWRCLARIQAVQPDGPWYLVGHSFGAVLAWEIARQILESRGTVGALILVDMGASLEARHAGAGLSSESAGNRIEQHRRLARTYAPKPLDCRVALIRAKDSPSFDLSDPTAGWRYLARGGVRVVDLPGDHFTVVRGASGHAIAEVINAAIAGSMFGVSYAAEVPPDTLWETIDRARQAALLGDLAGERAALLKACAADEAVPAWVFERLAMVRFALAEGEEGVAALQSAISRTPQPLQLCARFIGLLVDQGHAPAASASLAFARGVRIGNVAQATACAKIFQACGHTSDAERALRIGIGYMPESLELRRFLVQMLAWQKRGDVLLAEIEQALAIRSENDEAYRAMGRAALRVNATGHARQCFERCLAINPMRPDVVSALKRMQTVR